MATNEPPKNSPTPRLMTILEVVEAVRVTKPTLMREINEGRLRTTKIRGRTLFHPGDLEIWLRQCRGLDAVEDESDDTI